MSALTQTTIFATLITEHCYKCGMAFGMPSDFRDQRLKDRQTFYCPNGHGQVYSGKSEADKLRDELAAEQMRVKRERERRERVEKALKWERHSAAVRVGKARAAKRRLEHRVNCGVCPHCQRTFKQLAAHMKSKHPQAVKALREGQ